MCSSSLHEVPRTVRHTDYTISHRAFDRDALVAAHLFSGVAGELE